MRVAALVFASALVAIASAQQLPRTTPVPILKQINRHNDDGSYSYGYEGADGTFKIETKYPTGEVYGKYGYVDPTGERREIEYGATKRGFEPAGSGIEVPPPTFNNNNNNNVDNSDAGDYDDGSYREDPRIYNEYEQQYQGGRASNPAPRPAQFGAPIARAPAAPVATAAPVYRQQQQQQQVRQVYQPQPVANPHHNHNAFAGHPANNVNLHTGSYTISYSG